MQKILFIVGPTAIGKTAFALKIAEEFNGDIISADSRQVYIGMDIGTGKDIPHKFKVQSSKFKVENKNIPYYFDGKTKIWGLDLVAPNEEFSVADFARFAVPVINQIWADGKLPIVVGGTGLYIRALTQDLPDIFIPQNIKLRQKLHKLTTDQLQTELKQLSNTKFSSMNQSDQKNPRRLVRAIEIEMWKKTHSDPKPLLASPRSLGRKGGVKEREIGNEEIFRTDKLLIGLTASREELKLRIDQRVEARVEQGIVKEIQLLLNQGYKWDLPSFSALGYNIWEEYFTKKSQIPKNEQEKMVKEITQKWKKSEYQYAKRQLTWFKKEPGIHWFDITQPKWQTTALTSIKNWKANK